MNKKEILVEKPKKVVEFLQDYGFSFADVSKMMRNKDVKVNGKAEKQNILLTGGDTITFFYDDSMLEKKYDVVFESQNVLIVYKKPGIETAGEKSLESAIKNVFAVHRLDRNTEGLVVFAKNQDTKEKLELAFKKHLVSKAYLAEVVGKFDSEGKIFEDYLVKDPEKAFVKIVPKKVDGAVKIQTKISTIKSGKESSLLEVELLTGKTHQIRAHLAYLGNAIIGDGKYGKNEDNKKFKATRQKLACVKLAFGNVGIKELDRKTFEKMPSWVRM